MNYLPLLIYLGLQLFYSERQAPFQMLLDKCSIYLNNECRPRQGSDNPSMVYSVIAKDDTREDLWASLEAAFVI